MKGLNPMPEEYIGDGVYATFDNGDIVLDTRAQEPYIESLSNQKFYVV